MLSRLLFLEPKSEHRNEAVHSALLPTGLRVRVDPRESGRQARLVRTCPQANTRESTSRGHANGPRCAVVRSRPGLGPCRVNERTGVGSGRAVANGRRAALCGRHRAPGRAARTSDRAAPPAGDTSPQTGNTSNDKSVKVSTSYF